MKTSILNGSTIMYGSQNSPVPNCFLNALPKGNSKIIMYFAEHSILFVSIIMKQ